MNAFGGTFNMNGSSFSDNNAEMRVAPCKVANLFAALSPPFGVIATPYVAGENDGRPIGSWELFSQLAKGGGKPELTLCEAIVAWARLGLSIAGGFTRRPLCIQCAYARQF